jgi:S1-C subfamily serine protease
MAHQDRLQAAAQASNPIKAIVYDAQTTSGGSRGPLFNHQGQVIGINFAVVRDFGERLFPFLCVLGNHS